MKNNTAINLNVHTVRNDSAISKRATISNKAVTTYTKPLSTINDPNFQLNERYVAHELRSPLNNISAALEILYSTDLAPLQRRMLDKILTSQNSIQRLSEDLLSLDKITFLLQKTNLYNFLLDLSNVYRREAFALGIDFQFLYDAPTDLFVMVDNFRLEQLIFNLFRNALKFTKIGDILLKVSLISETSSSVTLNIILEDTGIGIPENLVDKIFDLGVSTRNGNGIGLAVCKNIVEAMNGEISVESAEGIGSIFKVSTTISKSL